MKKTSVILLLIVTAIFSLTTGAFAASKLTAIQAFLNGEVKFLKDGVNWRPTDDKGNEVLPITYLGKTYLPLSVIAAAFNIPVTYDGPKKTVVMGQTDSQTTLMALTKIPPLSIILCLSTRISYQMNEKPH